MDVLTGISNRRHFEMLYKKEWARTRRNRKPISLIMIDVDHFKAFNDHYGHPQGDCCLRQVASALADILRRPGDIVARYGGEEFIVLLPEINEAGTEWVAERMRRRISELAIPHAKSPTASTVSISVGWVTAIPGQKDSPGTLLETVDQVLYQAKKSGRDRVCSGSVPMQM